MDAIILAGGYGTRLLPLSEFIPKVLLPVDGKPLLFYILESLNDLSYSYPINNVIISTNQKFFKNIEHYLELLGWRYKNLNIELLDEPSRKEEEKLGSVKGLEFVINRKNLEEALVIAGDNYFDFKLNRLLEKYFALNHSILGIYDVKDLKEATRFGVVQLDSNNKIIKFEEKPSSPQSTLVSIGIYVFNKEAIGELSTYIINTGKKDRLGDFIDWLIQKKPVYGVIFERGIWEDIGSLESYRSLNEKLSNKK
ncbi:MAG: nucleotidyltransferase family protein [Candidatus Rehaiarchaeum fermentans]|nr:nucleotidyltransferase family protein [Candidatus Rehaiarchaeum fermentans]MCW1293448.1 nucleotidyltransferase family protein [Candidatus Rehaiarchaeum fermentans]